VLAAVAAASWPLVRRQHPRAHTQSRGTHVIIDFIETVFSLDSKSQAKPYNEAKLALTIARKLSNTLRSSARRSSSPQRYNLSCDV